MKVNSMNMKRSYSVLAAIIAMGSCLWTNTACADVKVPRVFSDHMVLQQGQEILVWGWADAGEEVTVTLGNQTAKTKASAAGQWRVELAKMAATRQPQQLTISGKNTVTFSDVLVGEVWFCSGQSNMAFELASAENAEKEIAKANYPQIRVFHTTFEARIRPQEDWAVGAWQVCTPQTAPRLSAVGYFFARKLHQQLKVPIGLVVSAVGGTAAECWMNRDGIAADPDLHDLEAQFVRQAVDFPPAQDTQGWQAPEYADVAWKTMTLPTPWEKSGQGMDQLDGAVWFRREVMVPQAWAGRQLTLHFGPIDDGDITYFNGLRIGGMDVDTPSVWTVPRQYTVPAAAVKAGRAVIAVRITDQLGAGGVVGTPEQMNLALADTLAETQSLAGVWKYAIEERWPPQQIPTTLYAGMVAPWTQFPIAGFVWYQGESNAGNAPRYRHLLRALIAGWRAAWKQPDVPFLVVQLPDFNKADPEPVESAWAALREAQAVVVSETPHTGLAVTLGLGAADNIHPKNKQDVGLRVALLALATVYHQPLTYSGPVCDGVSIEGPALRLHFAQIGKGLVAQGGALKGFAIAGADHRFMWANARIEGDTVTVQSDKVATPIALRYAWADNPVCNLTNAEGFPAAPFRTEGNTVIPRGQSAP